MFLVNNLFYRYPAGAFTLAVEALELSTACCTALTGGNGSGKTTLGKLLAGILRPTGGEILLDGTAMAGLRLAQIGTRVGYLFQEPSRQLFAAVVLEEITFAMCLRGVPEQEAAGQARALLSAFSMSRLEAAPVLTLSRGEKQRLAICAMLANHPAFLILDEPTTGLDCTAQKVLSQILAQLLAGGTGILLISHDKAFVACHAHRVLTMRDGRLCNEAAQP